MATVTIENLRKVYGDFVAVDNMNLDVKDGEFLILLGPSGCGKTTTLRMLAGFVEPNSGKLGIGGRDITTEPPYRRNIGLVFQNYALFPHLTIYENVAFGLRRRKLPEAEIKTRVAEALELVRLGHLEDRYPKQMSGGQQQRVAIARALAIRPDILLLDEPLSNLDAKLRLQVRDELKALQQKLGITTVMVTHDQDEAMYVGDRLVVMQEGKIQQIGSPTELYNHPANRFVASFIGRTNFVEGEIAAGQNTFTTKTGLAIKTEIASQSHTELMVRPEMIELSSAPTGEANCFDAEIASSVFLGGNIEIVATLPGGDTVTVITTVKHLKDKGLSAEAGSRLHLSFTPESAVLM
ncbi:ABC transporter ATP-binding protein [Neorhizobium sp. NCHU2750]|uniref:ABC transporter ATP-binding protein n=1 Tax=Neorhizobium sp. NCHU2750 TaxID=1825976 RepID=UPI000E74BB71|nr:spermidine/putrescine ABC transporter ATP-binding protein [Neorhizobium sp. NCHU2750]